MRRFSLCDCVVEAFRREEEELDLFSVCALLVVVFCLGNYLSPTTRSDMCSQHLILKCYVDEILTFLIPLSVFSLSVA